MERYYNDDLAGQTNALKLHELSGLFSDTSSEGDVVLTVRKDVQTVAKQALGDQKGSVVALDPETGGILAMWSNPSYDPNIVSSNDTKQAIAAKTLLDAAPDKPLLARPTARPSSPGSTFKVVTATAGLTSGKVTDTSPDYPVVDQLHAAADDAGRSPTSTATPVAARFRRSWRSPATRRSPRWRPRRSDPIR